MRCKIVVMANAIISLSLILHCVLNPIGGTDTGNPNITGVLYNKDGSRAKNAKVQVIPSDYNPRNGSSILIRFDSTTTDDTGGYHFDSLPTNTYNIFGSGEKGVSYQDSIAIIPNAKTRIPSDTLKAPGSLQGVVRLQPGDDCRTVFIIMMGTTMWTMPVDSLGNFSLSNLAEGDYHVRVITTLDQYQPMDMVIAVLSGKNTVLSDTIVQKYTGIPIPTGVQLAYDTLKQLVTLTWDKADPTLVKGYCVYQSNVGLNTTFEQINQSLITATIFTDSFTLENTTYSYKICAVDNDDNKGPLSAGVTVSIVPLRTPRITGEPAENQMVPLDSTLSLTVSATGAAPLIYAWYKNRIDSMTLITATQDDSTLWIGNAQISDSGYYFCVVSNAYGSDTSSALHVIVDITDCKPRITEALQNATVMAGYQVRLAVPATCTMPFSYAWYKNWNDTMIAGQTDSILVIDSVQMSDSGRYFCVVSNSCGADTSSAALITVIESSNVPIITSHPRDTTVYVSTRAQMNVVAFGAGVLSYAWYINTVSAGTLVIGQAMSTMTIVSAQVADSGNYLCVVTNAFGACTSSVATLSVSPIIRPENSLTLSASKIDAKQVTLAWTNSVETPYDSFRIWYAPTPIPDTAPSPSLYSSQGVAGTAVTTVIRNLKELTTYYFGIQGARIGMWSNIPAAAKTSVTTTKDTAQAITNTMKIIGVEYDTSTFKIRITYRVDALGFQHRVGFSWLQRSQGAPPLPSEFAEPILAPRVGEIGYTDQLGQVITFEFDPVKASPILEYGKEYYFGGWVSKVAEKWALPTDSSIFHYAIPQPKAVPAVLFKNTDTVTAFNGQVVLRKVDLVETSAILRLVEGLPLDSSGLVPVSIVFSLETNIVSPIRLLVGLRYTAGLIPVGSTAADIRMYHYDAVSAGWFADTATIIHDTAASVMYVQKFLSDNRYPFVLAVPDNGQVPYAQDSGRKP